MISPELIPLGVSDLEGQVAAIGQNAADIDIVDLNTGRLLRRHSGMGRALMIEAQQLVGLQNQALPHQQRLFRLGLLRDTDPQAWSGIFNLPEWADPVSSEEAKLVTKFGRDEQGYVLCWHAQRRYPGGAPPPHELQTAIDQQHVVECVEFDANTLAIRGRRPHDCFEDERARNRRGEALARNMNGFIYTTGRAIAQCSMEYERGGAFSANARKSWRQDPEVVDWAWRRT